WDDHDAKFLAYTLAGVEDDEADLHVAMNMSEQQINIELPVISGRAWCMALDTALKSPQDIVPLQDQQPVRESHYSVNARSVVVFENVER
ncbi:MAG: alpha amylase C-terminal domain-containing protein, partial [Methylobacter sp.]